MPGRLGPHWWAIFLVVLSGCGSEDIGAPQVPSSRWVLSPDSANVAILQFQSQTYAFEGGILRRFPLCQSCDADSLPLAYTWMPAGDFGWELFRYVGTQDTVFYGTTVFMGQGKMIVPSTLLPPASFQVVSGALGPPLSVRYFRPSRPTGPAEAAWAAAQTLDITREFSRRAYRVGVFYYAPDAMGNFAVEKWIIFLYAGHRPFPWGSA